jgi:hypothetical protein
VIFHEFTHKTVDCAACRSETAKDLGALFIAIQALEYRFELSDDFFGAVYQIQFFRAKCATFFLTSLPG